VCLKAHKEEWSENGEKQARKDAFLLAGTHPNVDIKLVFIFGA